MPLARYRVRENLPIVIVIVCCCVAFMVACFLPSSVSLSPDVNELRENICQKAAAARVPPRGAVSCCAPRGYYILNTTISLHLIFSNLTVIRYVNYLHIYVSPPSLCQALYELPRAPLCELPCAPLPLDPPPLLVLVLTIHVLSL